MAGNGESQQCNATILQMHLQQSWGNIDLKGNMNECFGSLINRVNIIDHLNLCYHQQILAKDPNKQHRPCVRHLFY